ncbi:hypothetical protein Btru_054298 [Bulinus truncatus]|nr:hypothetical protein Btru_054298 [Bulinus truncatus]
MKQDSDISTTDKYFATNCKGSPTNASGFDSYLREHVLSNPHLEHHFASEYALIDHDVGFKDTGMCHTEFHLAIDLDCGAKTSKAINNQMIISEGNFLLLHKELVELAAESDVLNAISSSTYCDSEVNSCEIVNVADKCCKYISLCSPTLSYTDTVDLNNNFVAVDKLESFQCVGDSAASINQQETPYPLLTGRNLSICLNSDLNNCTKNEKLSATSSTKVLFETGCNFSSDSSLYDCCDILLEDNTAVDDDMVSYDLPDCDPCISVSCLIQNDLKHICLSDSVYITTADWFVHDDIYLEDDYLQDYTSFVNDEWTSEIPELNLDFSLGTFNKSFNLEEYVSSDATKTTDDNSALKKCHRRKHYSTSDIPCHNKLILTCCDETQTD